MAYWNIRVVDEMGIGHTKIIQVENIELIKGNLLQAMMQFSDISEVEKITIGFENDGYLCVHAYDKEGEGVADVAAKEVTISETDRYKRLTEIIRNKEMLPPDQLDLLQSEGYDLEEIAIAALEETE